MSHLEKKTAVGGLVCLLIAAFFSKGFHHFDEHFQILEFAGSKLGLVDPINLSWEYQAKMRSALQPFLALSIYKLVSFLKEEDPFFTILILRLLSGIIAWICSVLVYRTFSQEVPKKWLLVLALPLTFFFWISVYNNVRFSSENWGGLFFMLGLALAYPAQKKLSGWLLLAGAALGISFASRFQMGLMIFGLFLWLLAIKKEHISNVFLLGLGFASALFIELIIAHWFYGSWPVTFWNYFEQNLIHGRAAQFGVEPWWFYIKILFVNLIPPFSIFFIVGILAFFWFFPKHVFTFCLVPFLLVHFALDHKEARFLFPLLGFLPIMMALSFSKLAVNRFPKITLPAFWIVNGILLLAVMFHPADKDTELYEVIYRLKPDRLVFTKDDPFMRAGTHLRFYQPRELKVLSVAEFQADKNQSGKSLLATEDFTQVFPADKVIYRSAPAWIKKFNFNHWLDRTRLWVLLWP